LLPQERSLRRNMKSATVVIDRSIVREALRVSSLQIEYRSTTSSLEKIHVGDSLADESASASAMKDVVIDDNHHFATSTVRNGDVAPSSVRRFQKRDEKETRRTARTARTGQTSRTSHFVDPESHSMHESFSRIRNSLDFSDISRHPP